MNARLERVSNLHRLELTNDVGASGASMLVCGSIPPHRPLISAGWSTTAEQQKRLQPGGGGDGHAENS